MTSLPVDLSLVEKYNQPGPRYTSYPPATKFVDTITWDALAQRIAANNQTERDLSLYFHIPFCETLCWFCGCTTVITLNHQTGATYVEHLEREIAVVAPRLHPQRQAVQRHWGGVSPTFLAPDEIRRPGRAIHQHIRHDERLLRDDVAAEIKANNETKNEGFGIPGVFSGLEAEWWLTQRTGFFGGATYEQFSKDATLEADGRRADVKVSSGLGLRLGITTRF